MVAFWKECKMTKQTFDDLINQINTVSNDVQRERGTLFEKLTLAYLKNEPTYKALYQNVWLLSEGFCCKVFQKIYFSVKLRKKTERTE